MGSGNWTQVFARAVSARNDLAISPDPLSNFHSVNLSSKILKNTTSTTNNVIYIWELHKPNKK